VSERLRIVQVGMGFWGRDWARLVIPEVHEAELVACVDSNRAALELLQEEAKIEPQRCFSSLGAALDATAADAILVTTNMHSHAPVTEAALEAGMHVLVEKPFTNDLDRAEGLVELAASRGLTLMVSQNYRFFPAPRTVAGLVKEESLGDLYSVAVDFRRNDASPPSPPRRHHTDDEQPLLIDMSIHHFDLMRFVLDAEPLAVTCEAENFPWTGYAGPPVAVASVRFDGVTVSYRGSWVSAGRETAWAGEWAMEFERGQVFWTSRGEDNVLLDRVTVRPRRGRARTLELPRLAHIDRAGSLEEFARALREGREPETSGRDNLATLALTLAAVRSATEGRPIGPSGPAGRPAGRIG
jgi:predicted dehydrogenase